MAYYTSYGFAWDVAFHLITNYEMAERDAKVLVEQLFSEHVEKAYEQMHRTRGSDGLDARDHELHYAKIEANALAKFVAVVAGIYRRTKNKGG